MIRIKKYAIACLATCAVAAPVALVVGLTLERTILPAVPRAAAAASSQSEFWRTMFINAMYAEHFGTLKDMGKSADAVVIGRITDVELSRVHQGDDPLDVVVFGKLIVDVDTLVAGKAEEKVAVEFIVPFLPEVSASVIEKMDESVPDKDIMLFLRETPTGIHRWVNDLGVWIIKEGQPTAPIALEPSGDADRFGSGAGLYKKELEGISTLEELAVSLFK